MSYLGQQLGQGQAERFVYTASGGETSVTTADDGRAVAYTVGQVDVYLNGAKLINGSDFTATTGTSITGLAALTASDVVEVFALSIFQASDTVSAASGGTFNGNVTVDANLSVTGTVDLNGGAIDGTVIGGATPAAGSFTTGQFGTSLNVDGTVTADGLTVDGTSTTRDDVATTSYYSTDVESNVVTHIANGTGTFAQEAWKLNDGGTASERMRLTTTGLGLGTTSPAVQLDVVGSSAAVQVSESGGAAARIAAGGSSAFLGTYSNHPLLFLTDSTEKMRIDSSGNVGIGESSVSQRLDVKTSTVNTGMLVYNTNTASGASVPVFLASESDGSTTNVSVENTGAGNMVFRTGATTKAGYGTERMRIDSSGNLLVGTTSVQGKLAVKQTGLSYNQALTLENHANSNRWSFLYGASNELYLGYNAADRGYFNASTGAYTAVSDSRLKKNIADISYGLNEILALRSVSYNMNEQDDSEVKTLGFIAQEAMEVIPESVSEMMGGMYGMDKVAIVPVLVKAIQEQQEIINDLRARVAQLEGA
jgi:hypothetical protein